MSLCLSSYQPVEHSGWKLLHADVFRPPRHRMLFCSSIGAGVQLIVMMMGVMTTARQPISAHGAKTVHRYCGLRALPATIQMAANNNNHGTVRATHTTAVGDNDAG